MCEMFCAPNLLGYPSLQSSEPEDELRHLPANCKSPKRLSTFRNPRRMIFFSRSATKQPQIQDPSWKRLNPTPPSTIFPSAFIAIQLLQCNQKSKVGTPKKSTKRNHGACKTPKKPLPFPTQEVWQKLLKQHQIEQPQLNPHPGPW